jgi:multidrug efflux pump subunit AcrA (membrane-fusion protein)
MNKSRIRILIVNLVLLVIAAGIGTWGWSALHPKAAAATAQTTTVSVADVQSTVSASGTVLSPGDVGVSPSVSEPITKIYIKVGQHVTAGTLMATLNNVTLLDSLNQAKATLATQQITFNSDKQAIANAQLNAAQQLSTNAVNATTYQASVDAAKLKLSQDQTIATQNIPVYAANVATAKASLDNANLNYNNYEGLYGPSGITLTFCNSINTINSNCTQLISDWNAVQSAQTSYNNSLVTQTQNLAKDQATIVSDQAAVTSAQTSQSLNLKKDAASLVSAQNAVTSTQNQYDLFKAQNGIDSDTPAAADFQVAQSSIGVAQNNYDQAFIKAPVTGDVASISAVVGQVAPTSTVSTIGSVSGFIVLTNVAGLEVSAGFSESDAAKIKAGELVSYSFTALPNANATGKVISVNLLPTTSQSATTYTAYFSIDGAVSGLKPGMTATVQVLVNDAPNALSANPQAITTSGNSTGATSTGIVNVVTTKAGKQVLTPTPVVLGLIGDSLDQIISGVKSGDVLAIKSSASSVSANGFPTTGVPGGAAAALAGAGGGRFGG